MASYRSLYSSGALARRAQKAVGLLGDCALCPRGCHVDRLAGELGFCRTGRRAQIASWNLHFGEEDPLVGESGSGTIFFAQCNLDCVFCQNWDISQGADTFQEAEPDELAGVMLELARQGAHNINLVTPSHVVPQILEGLEIACGYGLDLPLVYNSSGYDEVATLRLLDGVVDIYMPDAKFADPERSQAWCAAPDYPAKAKAAIAEMHSQVGDLVLDERGVAVRGLLVRHLVMPGESAGTAAWMQFLAGLSRETYVNIMDQYRPCGRAHDFPELARRASSTECAAARQAALEAGLTRLDERRGGLAAYLMRRLKEGDVPE